MLKWTKLKRPDGTPFAVSGSWRVEQKSPTAWGIYRKDELVARATSEDAAILYCDSVDKQDR